MILRRLGKAIRRQDPATILVELFVLIVGVVLGLQVDDWNAERQQRQLEATLIERLTEDFEQIEDRLTASIERYEEYLVAIVRVRDRVNSGRPPAAGDERSRFMLDLGSMLGSRIPAGSSPTYIEMISSGVFDVLEDDELKRLLVDYDQRQGFSLTAWKALRDQSLQFSEPILYAMTLGVPTEDTSNTNPIDFDFQRMRDDAAFDSALGVQISVQSNNLELQTSQLESAREVLARLRPESSR